MTETTTPTAVPWTLGRALAQGYERELVPELFEPWGRELVALADPQPGERVLDVACGTGIIARLAAARVGEHGAVTGLDVLPDMLRVARERAAAITPPIDWTEASAVAIPLPDAAFDVVLCQQGLQFFDDRAAALSEMRRVTRPGGRLAVSVWRDLDFIPGYAALTEAFGRHAPEAVGFMRAVAGLADAGELHGLLARAGYRDVHVTVRIAPLRFPSVAEFVRRLIDLSPVPGLRDLDEQTRGIITSEVAAATAAYVDDDGFVFPIEAHVATAVAR